MTTNSANNTYAPALTFGADSVNGSYHNAMCAITAKKLSNEYFDNISTGQLEFFATRPTATPPSFDSEISFSQPNMTISTGVGIGYTSAPQVRGRLTVLERIGINNPTPTVALDVIGAGLFSGNVSGATFSPTSSTLSRNGMYLSTTDTLGFSTASTQKMIINSSGNVSIGNTNDTFKLDVSGTFRANNATLDQSRVNTSKYPVGHYTPGEHVFEIDPTWTNQQLQSYFNSSTVSWTADSTAPGGYAILIEGAVNLGGSYGSGLPYIPIDSSDIFYMECWIRSLDGSLGHYLGSDEFNQNFTSLGGNPGTYGYWVMSNTITTTTWTKVSGYISGFGTSVGQFRSGAKYWTPMALFNFNYYGGTRSCLISGWKITKVNIFGNRNINGTLGVTGAATFSSTISASSFSGAGTGLTGTASSLSIGGNAGTVGGFSASQSILSNHIVVRDINSYIFGNYINMTDDGNPGGGTAITSFITKQGDNYYRSVSPTNAMVSIRGVASGNWSINVTGTAGSETLSTVTNRGNSTSQNIVFSNGRKGLVGVYDAAQTQAIFAMGAAYVLTDGGASSNIGSLYGLAWSYNPNYSGAGNNPQSKANLNHQLLLMQDGITTAAMGSGIWTSGSIAVGNITNSTTAGRIDASNDIVAYSTSDRRLKDNIINIENSINKLENLNGVKFNWKKEHFDIHGYEGDDVGVIAQEIEEVLPEAIRVNETGYLSVRYEKIIPLLIEGIKELSNNNKQQQNQIDILNKKIEFLMSKK